MASSAVAIDDRPQRKLSRPGWVAAALAAVGSAGLTTLGLKVDLELKPPVSRFGMGDVGLFAVLTIVLFGVFAAAAWALGPLRATSERPAVRWYWWAAAWGGVMVAWLPFYLTYFPGLISPDSIDTLGQLRGYLPFSNHHPIAFTLLVGAIVMPVTALGGSMQAAVAAYSLFQLALTALTVVGVVAWVQRRGAARWLSIALAAVLVLNPVIPTLGVTMWKDIPFALVFVWFCLQLFDAVASRGAVFTSTRWSVVFVVTALAAGLLRNNAIYVLILTLVVLAIAFRTHWRRIVPAVLVVLIALPLITGPLYRAAGFKEGNAAEALGVPLQQIGYVLKYDGLLQGEDAAKVGKVLDVATYQKAYRPHYANPVKFNKAFNNDYLNENTGEFISTWAELLPENFVSYVKGYAALTYGYYTVGKTDLVYPRVVPNSTWAKRMELHADPFFGPGSKRDGRLAAITHGVADIAVGMGILLLVGVVLVQRRRWAHLLWLLPSFGLWGTLLVAAPISGEFRYLYAAYLFAPVAVALLFLQDRSKR